MHFGKSIGAAASARYDGRMAEALSPNDRPAGALVLVVDDFPETVDVVASILSLRGCYVALAMDGIDAVAIARERHPDAIIMDFAMPRMNGLEATRLLKSYDDTRKIPVILYTAHGGPEVEVEAQRAGCIAVALKPLENDRLIALVERILASTSVSTFAPR